MDNNKKGIIVAAISLGVVGLAYYFLVHKSGSRESTSYNNFDSLLSNTGLKPNKGGVLIIPFNDKNNFAQFYTNDRVIIFNDADKNVLVKGTYSDGGKTIKLDSGKEITSGSVYYNLLQTIK
jgi:hypothetical protein